ncbi:MAG: hypothetical protein LC790_13530 [Actinobacteria bacterium]|nr:hypothetical protein [Actinomycetota bacterium]
MHVWREHHAELPLSWDDWGTVDSAIRAAATFPRNETPVIVGLLEALVDDLIAAQRALAAIAM